MDGEAGEAERLLESRLTKPSAHTQTHSSMIKINTAKQHSVTSVLRHAEWLWASSAQRGSLFSDLINLPENSRSLAGGTEGCVHVNTKRRPHSPAQSTVQCLKQLQLPCQSGRQTKAQI